MNYNRQYIQPIKRKEKKLQVIQQDQLYNYNQIDEIQENNQLNIFISRESNCNLDHSMNVQKKKQLISNFQSTQNAQHYNISLQSTFTLNTQMNQQTTIDSVCAINPIQQNQIYQFIEQSTLTDIEDFQLISTDEINYFGIPKENIKHYIQKSQQQSLTKNIKKLKYQ